MPEELQDPWLNGFAATILLASIGTWLFLIGRWKRRGEILTYIDRDPVPWGPQATWLAIAFVFLQLVLPQDGGSGRPPDEIPMPWEVIERIGSMILFQSVVVASFFAAIIVSSGARLRDLGLPVFAHEVGHDVAVGAMAWLAAVAPVYGIQALLTALQLQDKVTEHPLIEMVLHEPSPVIMILAMIAAVVVAPICEEITFRLLLQGWLEKWEDRHFGWSASFSPNQLLAELPQAANGEIAREHRTENGSIVELDLGLPGETQPTISQDFTSGDAAQDVHLGRRGLLRGWVPILISSALFSLAHFGHGVDPLPLFPLAIALGYTYQRTHRILPCMVTHFLFNSASMVALWRIVVLQSD
jgi:membrane protease YdiL (CAAX protease family)